MTLDVMTQEYRAVELLLGAKQYTNAVDIWSVGCVMAEMYRRVPLFKGESCIAIVSGKKYERKHTTVFRQAAFS